MYVVRVRLQQACDAGVLAGRKFLLASNSTTLDSNAATQAQTFFTNNFRSGWMGTTTVVFTPTKTTDNQVAGTASATVPMAIMGIFGVAPQAIPVTCQARYDVADTDVMFVLDTTGSMAVHPQRSRQLRPGDGVVYPARRHHRLPGAGKERIADFRASVRGPDLLRHGRVHRGPVDALSLWLRAVHLHGECRLRGHIAVDQLHGADLEL